MAALIAFAAFIVIIAAASLAGMGTDSRTYPRWCGASDVDRVNPRVE